MKDNKHILDRYCIEYEVLNDAVIKVINPKKIDTQSLMFDLEECSIITSTECSWGKSSEGRDVALECVYYIILGDKDVLRNQEYLDVAIGIYGDAMIQSYSISCKGSNYDLPLYRKDEV